MLSRTNESEEEFRDHFKLFATHQNDENLFTVYSIDPGTVNLVICKMTVSLTDKSIYNGIKVEWVEIVNIKYRNKEDDKAKRNARSNLQMMDAFYDTLETGPLAKITDHFEAESIKYPKRKLNIVIEDQMDRIKKNDGAPINYGLSMYLHGYLSKKIGRHRLSYIAVSGNAKYGLSGIYDEERKKQTIPVCCNWLRSEGQEDTAEWIESLRKPKPAQDVSDAINQGLEFMLKIMQDGGYVGMKDYTKRAKPTVQNAVKLIGSDYLGIVTSNSNNKNNNSSTHNSRDPDPEPVISTTHISNTINRKEGPKSDTISEEEDEEKEIEEKTKKRKPKKDKKKPARGEKRKREKKGSNIGDDENVEKKPAKKRKVSESIQKKRTIYSSYLESMGFENLSSIEGDSYVPDHKVKYKGFDIGTAVPNNGALSLEIKIGDCWYFKSREEDSNWDYEITTAIKECKEIVDEMKKKSS